MYDPDYAICILLFQEITLSFNEIRSRGATAMADAMGNKESLVKLDLDGKYVVAHFLIGNSDSYWHFVCLSDGSKKVPVGYGTSQNYPTSVCDQIL